jgi:two-component system LytT family response regulator
VKVRCLVVDDEPLGRDRVTTLLRALPDAEIVGECETGTDAVRAIVELSPDLIFLDVQMPGMDGFEVLASIPAAAAPAVIFVTAYDAYAIRAFEVHAQDYLLKPFERARFYEAFRHAAARLRADRAGTQRRLVALLDEMDRQRPRRARIPIRAGGRVTFLPVDDIDWVEAADNYVKIHAGAETHLIRQTLSKMEQALPPADFIRIHRSAIVNTSRISEIQPWFNGEYVVLLRDGTRVYSSRQYRDRVRELMEC